MDEANYTVDFALLSEALEGTSGEDQQRIARVGLQWLAKLLRKNADYGSSVWKRPKLAPECSVATAIRVRMSDKIERLETLLTKGEEAEVGDESIDDSMGDLGSYCLLELARPDRLETEESESGCG